MGNRNSGGFAASPLARTLTPPLHDSDLHPFPSVESSADSSISGRNFHFPSSIGLGEGSPGSISMSKTGSSSGYRPRSRPGYSASSGSTGGTQSQRSSYLDGLLERSNADSTFLPQYGNLSSIGFSPSQLQIQPQFSQSNPPIDPHITSSPVSRPTYPTSSASGPGPLHHPVSLMSAGPGFSPHYQQQSTSNSRVVEIYCAACHRLAPLSQAYACTECICGVCPACVDVWVEEQARGRGVKCPKCGAVGGKFKRVGLDVR